jgi:hypothetical protein
MGSHLKCLSFLNAKSPCPSVNVTRFLSSLSIRRTTFECGNGSRVSESRTLPWAGGAINWPWGKITQPVRRVGKSATTVSGNDALFKSNVPAHRRGADDARHATETLSRGSVKRLLLNRFSVRLDELHVVKMLVNILRYPRLPPNWACCLLSDPGASRSLDGLARRFIRPTSSPC